MKKTKHSLIRMSQRGISHAMADLVYAYGFIRGDKVILNKKAATARLIEARAEKAALSKTLEVEIRNLTKLIDKQGSVLVMVGDVLVTAYGLH